MRFRRNTKLVEIDPDAAQLRIQPVRGPMLLIAGSILAAGALAVLAGTAMHHGEAMYALGGVWAFVALLFAGWALWPARRVKIDLLRGMVELDDKTHSLSQASFQYERQERMAGRRRIVLCVVSVSLPVAGTVKLLELDDRESGVGHNLVAGLQQAQNGDRAGGVETLREAIENAGSNVGREVLMVTALILAPLLVFWLKGAFN